MNNIWGTTNMRDGFIRVGAATPEMRVGAVDYNCDRIIDTAFEAAKNQCSLLTFPELSITGYTCGDLFLQKALLDKASEGLLKIAFATEELDMVIIVGLPYRFEGKLYNVAAVICHGSVLGIVPKQNIPNYSEFYELRHFTPYKGYSQTRDGIPFGEMIFDSTVDQGFSFAVEICEDLWVPAPPSIGYAQAGATVICNLSASDEVIGKLKYRRDLVSMHSAKTVSAYVYCDCGFGESTQDMVFGGHDIIAENGNILGENRPFADNGILYSDVDLERIMSERGRMNTFCAGNNDIKHIPFDLNVPDKLNLRRRFAMRPFVPSSKGDLAGRCEMILTMQATGLATRLKHINCRTAVIGLSGGLDSTLALIVTIHAFDMLKYDRKGIIAVTMPCFGTTSRTRNNSMELARAYGASLREINIREAVNVHFGDIGHDDNIHDVTYENSQARERTQVIMDIANKEGGIVVGTGDLSELALGWATYNGDHMSMYGVNSSIPKTLVRYLVSYEAERLAASDPRLSSVLKDIIATPVSPELLPPTSDGTISQKTEELVGPYELHDFFLYYFIRFGFGPAKIFRMACIAFDSVYDRDTILKWEKIFIRRFFTQQFKRSCLPDGPKVGTVTLSPRGDWRMPTDADYNLWMEELDSMEDI